MASWLQLRLPPNHSTWFFYKSIIIYQVKSTTACSLKSTHHMLKLQIIFAACVFCTNVLIGAGQSICVFI